ncbi:MAG TPA: uracil-DNA glycosylase [Acidobacteriaceae bacterium]|nr:uracil-DNA glycosylase [Acidobacteriaceae bacterium]
MATRLSPEKEEQVRARIAYFRDLGIFDFYRRSSADGETLRTDAEETLPGEENSAASITEPQETTFMPKAAALPVIAPPGAPVAPGDKAAALAAIRADLGDCTRCALAQGRNKIVYGDGDPNARLMFVGEGPGADEDAQGLPFVGRAGQLLNNMISAMGLRRDQVYIANIVKCRPPQNRVPEPVEANTCSPFLFRQIDVIRPEVLVALGATAATYLLGGKSPLAALRGRIHQVRGAKLIVTYHPAYLLRDPRQKKEAWADLQIAMAELGLAKSS